MSDMVIGGVSFDMDKVFPKNTSKRADDVAEIYKQAIERGVKENKADHFVARRINKDDKGNDNVFTDATGKKFTINPSTQREAIEKLNADKSFKYYLEKDSKKSKGNLKGGSKTGYKIREKTAEELGQIKQPTPTPTTTTRTTRSRTNTTTAKPTENQNSGKATNK